MGDGKSHGARQAQPTPFSLRRRVQLCAVMLALESYISFEEIFMLPVLQRVEVPVLLVSMPGTISSAIGVVVIPLLGWASDRVFCCSKLCGQKRPFAVWTLLVTSVGVGMLVYVCWASLLDTSLLADLFNATCANLSLPCPNNASASWDTGVLAATAAASQNLSGDSLVQQPRALAEAVSGGEGVFTPFTSTAPDGTPSWLWQQTSNASLTSPPPSTQSSTQAANSSTDPPTPSPSSSSSSSDRLTTMGLLGIIGFVLSDHGYDSSMSTFKAYMIAVTPASQHDDIFILGTLTGAVGGCVTSLLGFVDLASLFPDEVGSVLDTGMAQGLVQALILLAKLLLLGFVSLMTGSERCRDARDSVEYSPAENYDTVFDQCGNVKKEYETSFAIESNGNHIDHNENSPLIPESLTCCARISGLWKRWKRRFFLCVMTFLGLSTNYSYFVYVSNYVAEVIFEGDPNANSKSQAYADYVFGVHVASLGMLTFYLLFVVYNIFHQKILNKIGMRAEYVGSSVCCAALMLTLAATDNIVVFFLNAITMAVFRAAVYTVPFILSNNLAKKEAAEQNGSSAHSSGVAMASITAMIPGSYFLVSLIMGPLMDLSGYAGMPILIAAAACLLNTVAAFFVQFE